MYTTHEREDMIWYYEVQKHKLQLVLIQDRAKERYHQAYLTRPVFTPFPLKVAWSGRFLIDIKCCVPPQRDQADHQDGERRPHPPQVGQLRAGELPLTVAHLPPQDEDHAGEYLGLYLTESKL